MKVSLILACAGKGERAGFLQNKLLVEVGDTTCLNTTLNVFIDSGLIDEYIIVCAKRDYREISSIVPPYVKLVIGGDTRTQSVSNALDHVSGDIVLIHDGARPFVSVDTIKSCIDDARRYGSGIAAIPSRDTVCMAGDGGKTIDAYIGKTGLYIIQTPQAFKIEQIRKAYILAGNESYNDDSEIYARFIGKPHISEGSAKNTKITFEGDLDALAERPICRVGVGFDCHKLVEGRKLFLGGVKIPHTKGLLGHSDADVLTHAIMDALLSAVALRDIGYHFPDTDEKFKDADSIDLLHQVLNLIKDEGYSPYNVSAVIMAEQPKISPYIPTITRMLADNLGIEESKVGIGATTLEGLGFVGREEGICVRAFATVIKTGLDRKEREERRNDGGYDIATLWALHDLWHND